MDTNTLFKFNDWIRYNEFKVDLDSLWSNPEHFQIDFEALKELFYADWSDYKESEGN